MIFHRHSKMIMGGGVCLLIALTGVVATASVATTQSADTSFIETRDTAEIAVFSTATFDVATPTKPESIAASSQSTVSSQKTVSEHKSVSTSSKSTTSQKTSSEHQVVDTASQSTHNQEVTFETEIEDTSAQSNDSQEVTFEPEVEKTVYQPADNQDTTFEPEVEDTSAQSTVNQDTVSEAVDDEDTTSSTSSVSSWNGPVLNSFAGIIQGPSGSETYYNLDMSGVVSIMKSLGYDYDYWVRDDGVKMYGKYVMCAADLSIRPKGTIIETSLGLGMVCDTGGFVASDSTRLDIAVTW